MKYLKILLMHSHEKYTLNLMVMILRWRFSKLSIVYSHMCVYEGEKKVGRK